MANSIADAPVRATKATPRAKAAPSPVSKFARPALTEHDHIAVAVGSQIFHLLTPIIEGPFIGARIPGLGHLVDAGNHAWDLCNIEAEWIENAPPPTVADLVTSTAVALNRTMIELSAAGTDHAAMLYCVRLLVVEAFRIAQDLQHAYFGLPATSAELAALAKFQQPGMEAAAIGAGARRFSDRPAPPIRRVKDDSEEMGPTALTRKQLLCVLEVAANNLSTINTILMLAQEEPESFALAGLIDAAQALTRHCGGMVDTAAGEAILGGHDRWNFGPNFAALGKADAA